MDDQEEKQEEEIAEESDEATGQSADANKATVLLSLEDVIKSHISSLDKLASELKEKRQMFSDAFENDTTYKEQENQAKEANKVKLATKKEILKQASIAQVAQNIRDISTELREKKNALSDYLLEYQRMTGANEIEGDDGRLHQIVNQAKLIRGPQKE